MSKVEKKAGVTLKDFELVGEKLAQAIENKDFQKAVEFSRLMTGLDEQLKEAADAFEVDISYLRTTLKDAQTVNRPFA